MGRASLPPPRLSPEQTASAAYTPANSPGGGYRRPRRTITQPNRQEMLVAGAKVTGLNISDLSGNMNEKDDLDFWHNQPKVSLEQWASVEEMPLHLTSVRDMDPTTRPSVEQMTAAFLSEEASTQGPTTMIYHAPRAPLKRKPKRNIEELLAYERGAGPYSTIVQAAEYHWICSEAWQSLCRKNDTPEDEKAALMEVLEKTLTSEWNSTLLKAIMTTPNSLPDELMDEEFMGQFAPLWEEIEDLNYGPPANIDKHGIKISAQVGGEIKRLSTGTGSI